MSQLSELFSVGLLDIYVSHGYISRKNHPELPLTILNYTQRAVIDGLWDEVTSSCRGLIYDTVTGEVVARPWKKFFNGPEDVSASWWDEDTPVEVTEKVDGSLGILYPDASQPTGFAIATRGSFVSAQARHATSSYQISHRLFRPRPQLTYLFEIVYPDNRIVVNYGQDDALYLLGMVDINTGKYFSPRHPSIDIPRTRVLRYEKYGIFARNFRHQHQGEGVVVRNLLTDEMLKFKRPEYVSLHRLVFGLNAAGVWEKLQTSDDTEWREFIDNFPSDVQKWIGEVASRLTKEFFEIDQYVAEAYDYILTTMGEDGYADRMDERERRKGFAEMAAKTKYPGLLFLRWDRRDGKLTESIWKMVKPSGAEKPRGEDW